MLSQDIRSELTVAMKARDEVRLRVLRGLLAAFTNELVAKKQKPDAQISDDDALAVIKRAVKQRQDSIEQFEKGGRADLADVERAELEILEAYLPETMSKDAIEEVARAKKEELGVSDKSKMGILMGAVMAELKGKVDGKDVKDVVESILA
ncbi:MAG: GatB/YqeY domain-containing protein [Candidatus Pacebacteria bacterium]|nr:GatB/YqeY domain-containing protein [Candidatus Paceibacterota bacterium]